MRLRYPSVPALVALLAAPTLPFSVSALAQEEEVVHIFDGRFSSPFGVTAVAISPDGEVVAAGARPSSRIALWNARTGRLRSVLSGHEVGQHGGEVSALCFSTDGSSLLSGATDETARLWDSHTGRPLQVFRGHESSLVSVCYGPANGQITTSAFDGTVRLWDIATGAELAALTIQRKFQYDPPIPGEDPRLVDHWSGVDHPIAVHSALTYDGHFLATVAEPSYESYGVVLWDAQTLRKIRSYGSFSDEICTLQFSMDGKLLLAGGCGWDESIKVWEVTTGRLVGTLDGAMSGIYDASFFPDGASILAAGEASWRPVQGGAQVLGTLAKWRVSGGMRTAAFGEHGAAISSVDVSRDGARLVSGAYDGTVKLWDGTTGQLLRTWDTTER